MKSFLKGLLILLAVLLPFGALTAAVFGKNVYGGTFMGELGEKCDRLHSVTEPKVIVVGGSSVAFGLDSKMLEDALGMPVVNFGLYATLGTKLMLDLSEDEVREGDVVVIAPELDSQTLSLYFNAEATWQAFDGNLSLLRKIKKENRSEMAAASIGFAGSKIRHIKDGGIKSEGVYAKSSFDEYGDIVFDRPYNVMKFGYDVNKPVSFGTEQYSEDFLCYLSDYIASCREKGARVCYSFPPVNESGVSPETEDGDYQKLYSFLAERLDCEIIGSPKGYILDQKYFYDSNFHTNSAGTKHHTAHLALDLRRMLGMTDIIAFDLPEPEEKPADAENTEQDDGTDDGLFVYAEKTDNKGKLIGYTVVGTTDDGKLMAELELPRSHGGKPVMELGKGALGGCTGLRKLTIRDNIVSIVSGAFENCPNLKAIHIYNEDESTMCVDQVRLFDGAADGITIYLHSEKSYESYITGYFWANYAGKMKLET